MPQKPEPAYDLLPLQKIQCACTNLKMAARSVGRAYDKALAPAGVNATQYAILINVRRYQPISQMRLAGHLDMERTTLYRAVELLEKNGYITATSVGEGVVKILKLSSRGEKVTDRAKKEWEKVQQSFLKSFGEKKWEEFCGMLGMIRRHFK